MLYIFLAIILIALGFMIGAGVLFIKTIPRSGSSASAAKMSGGSWDKHRVLLKESREWLDAAKCENMSILSFDAIKLAGFYYPAANPNGCLIAAFNGYRSDSRSQFSHITRYLNGLGFDVALIDDRAHGESGGKYVGFGALDRYDCKKWAEYLSEKFGGKRKIYLYGVSMGAATVLMASGLKLPRFGQGHHRRLRLHVGIRRVQACVKQVVSSAVVSALADIESVLPRFRKVRLQGREFG